MKRSNQKVSVTITASPAAAWEIIGAVKGVGFRTLHKLFLANVSFEALFNARSGTQLRDTLSELKIKGSEIQQGLKQLLVESLGMYGAAYENDMMPITSDYLDIGPPHMQGILAEHLYGRGATIFGGSNEIQRNIVSRMLLGT